MIFSYPALQGGQIICGDALLEGTISDSTAPVIQLLGPSTHYWPQYASYFDPGAIATDNLQGNITGNMVVVNLVDVDVPDQYPITYNVVDESGNPAIEVVRTVIIVSSPDTGNIAIGDRKKGRYRYVNGQYIRIS